MKVIFLDIDGVMNFNGSEAAAPSGKVGVIDRKVSLLSSIIKSTNAKVVLISSWIKDWNSDTAKCTEDGKYLDRKMLRKGIHILDKIESAVPDSIGEYLRRNDHITHAVILSKDVHDVFLDGSNKTHAYSLIIDPAVGLTDEDAKAVIDLLEV